MVARTWWWGTHPEAGLGTPTGLGEGLWRMLPGGGEPQLALVLPAPSFIVAHPDLPLLYAVTEEAAATVVCVDVSDPGSPRIVGTVSTGGSGAGHVMISADTLTLYVTNYESGEVVVVALAADGTFASAHPIQVLPGQGSGPVEDRQGGPHPHFSGYAPDGETLLVADLGTDQLRRFRVLADGSLLADGVAAVFPPGSGPRHFAIRGENIHVVCELDHRLRTLRWDSASRTAEVIADLPTTLVPQRTGDTIYDAHVVVVSSVVLVSVRGCNVIALFDLDSTGIPVYRGSFDSGGDWPRHFAVIGEKLAVGNARSHTVCTFDLADVLSFRTAEHPEFPEVPGELPHSTARVLSPACVCEA